MSYTVNTMDSISQCVACPKRFDLIQTDCMPHNYICIDCLDATVAKAVSKFTRKEDGSIWLEDVS